MRRLLASLTIALALLGAGLAGAKPGGGGGNDQEERDVVRVATSGSYSERVEKLPITRKAGDEERVVMSLTPRQLPSLAKGDKLKLSSEVQVTLNCPDRMERCVGPPYKYDPEVAARLVLAKSADSRRGVQIGRTKKASCQQRRPRQHHCVYVITDAAKRIGKLKKLPCPRDACFVNLVMGASNPRARKNDVLIVGGNKPSGAIPQDRGRINAVLFSPGEGNYPRPRKTRERITPQLPLDLKRHVVYSQKLRNVRAGQQIAVAADVVTERTGLPYSVRTSSQLILAGSRDEVEPGPFARRLGGKGEIGEANGFNCTRDHKTCTTRKVGVLRFARSARTKGRSRPVFVNLVMIAGAKRVDPADGDTYEVLKRGGLSVTRYAKPQPRR